MIIGYKAVSAFWGSHLLYPYHSKEKTAHRTKPDLGGLKRNTTSKGGTEMTLSEYLKKCLST